MKVLPKNQTADEELERIIDLDHENVVKYFDHFELEMKEFGTKVTIKLCIVTEFCQVSHILRCFIVLFR